MTDVKRLLDEATPLPWRHGPLFWEGWSLQPTATEGGRRVFEVPHVYPNGAHQPGVFVDPNIGRSREPDAALIVHAVDRLPDYEAAVDALERLVRRTPFIPVEGGLSVTLSIEQVAEQQAILRRLREPVPA